MTESLVCVDTRGTCRLHLPFHCALTTRLLQAMFLGTSPRSLPSITLPAVSLPPRRCLDGTYQKRAAVAFFEYVAGAGRKLSALGAWGM